MARKPPTSQEDTATKTSADDGSVKDTHSEDPTQFGADHSQADLNTLNAQPEVSEAAATAVNTQIEATIALLNKQVTENPTELARVGLELATSQSLSIAVQDAVDHMRRMQVLAEATLARAAMPGASQEDKTGAKDAQAGVDAAVQTLQRVTDIARAGSPAPKS